MVDGDSSRDRRLPSRCAGWWGLGPHVALPRVAYTVGICMQIVTRAGCVRTTAAHVTSEAGRRWTTIGN